MVESSHLLKSGISDFWTKSISEGSDQIAFIDAKDYVVNWALSRRIFCENIDFGFLTDEMISVMLLVVREHLQKFEIQVTVFSIVQNFYKIFSTWPFNECSVASQCCRSHELCGSLISECEGIDSDCEDDEGEEVHPSKRFRYDLGQIRDLRRFYEIDEVPSRVVAKVSVSPGEVYIDKLDYVDCMTIVHPLHRNVNLAVRVLESQKKLIVQELTLADFLLGDSLETTQPSVLKDDDYQLQIVFSVTANSPKILQSITDIVILENWFLVQETQAFQGVFVIPPNSATYTQNSAKISAKFDFIAEYPYNAKPGLVLDFNGPVSRAMLRARQQIKDLPNYTEELAGNFSLNAKIV